MPMREMRRSVPVLNVTTQSSGLPPRVEENIMCLESGDQVGDSLTPLELVIRVGLEPSGPMT